MSTPVVKFRERYPDVYRLEQVYDPDIHSTYDPNSNLFIPAIGSLIVDNNVPEDEPIPMWTVVGTTEEYKSILKPVYSKVEESDLARPYDYGNKMFYCFYDNGTTPTTVRIDSTFLILGDNAHEYILYDKDTNGIERAISLYQANNNSPITKRVPIVSVNNGCDIKRCLDAQVSSPLQDGQDIILKVYDATGYQIMEVILICKQGGLLNTLAPTSVITNFILDSSQDDVNGDIYLYRGQDKEEIGLFPKLLFNTGAELIVPVDNQSTFMYNWNDINNDLVGCEYNILLKHFLADNIQTPIVQQDGARFVTTEKLVRIIPYTQNGISKLIPILQNINGNYSITWLAYTADRKGYVNVTNRVTYETGYGFDETISTPQVVKATIPSLPEIGSTTIYTETVTITIPNDPNVNYTIQYDGEAPIFGERNGLSSNVMSYDAATNTYLFPTNIYPDVDTFLNYCYRDIVPPFRADIGESIAPEPTLFTLRYNSTIVLPLARSVNNYASPLSLTEPSQGYLQGKTLTLEFWLDAVNGENPILIGVPITVN